VQRLT
jgi:DNA-binding FrmR family transcriptional regulator